jgi:hypothetical protein
MPSPVSRIAPKPRLNHYSNWSRRVLLDNTLILQVHPELSRNLSVHRGVVFQDLLFSADTHHQSCGNVRRSSLESCLLVLSAFRIPPEAGRS